MYTLSHPHTLFTKKWTHRFRFCRYVTLELLNAFIASSIAFILSFVPDNCRAADNVYRSYLDNCRAAYNVQICIHYRVHTLFYRCYVIVLSTYIIVLKKFPRDKLPNAIILGMWKSWIVKLRVCKSHKWFGCNWNKCKEGFSAVWKCAKNVARGKNEEKRPSLFMRV